MNKYSLSIIIGLFLVAFVFLRWKENRERAARHGVQDVEQSFDMKEGPELASVQFLFKVDRHDAVGISSPPTQGGLWA